jgi:hypothetical protein
LLKGRPIGTFCRLEHVCAEGFNGLVGVQKSIGHRVLKQVRGKSISIRKA